MTSEQPIPSRPERSPGIGRTWGLRFSVWDAFILLLAAGLMIALRPATDSPTWAVAVVLGHFFLFCNVFRIHRKKELLWAAFFILNAAFWLDEGKFDWSGVLLMQTPLTIVLIGWEMHGPWYHGIGARRINAHLDRYLKGEI